MFGWLVSKPASVPEPLHVRLHVLHEGTDSGDMTIEGWQVAERSEYLLLERASILHADGRRTTLSGHVDVPRSRVILREHLVAVSAPLLDMTPVGVGA